MNEFMQAVEKGDFVAAKSAFGNEMAARTALAVQQRRDQIAADACPMSQYSGDDE